MKSEITRRFFIRKATQSVVAVAVASVPAVAAAKTGYETEGWITPDDMVPRFKEVRELVDDFERYDQYVIYFSGNIFIGNPVTGAGGEPLSLWPRYRACDHATLIEYLELTGRTSWPSHIY